MKPLTDRATEGRVNPKGIPCLYLSTDRETAMAETRPWIGSYVSVAHFVVRRDLDVIDCSLDDEAPLIIFDEAEPEPAEREKDTWWYINQAFSEPVTRSDNLADYAPTQMLAEAFRSKGCDGILYGSKVGTGKNLAVFDLAAADLISCHLHEVQEVTLKFSKEVDSYYIDGHVPPGLFPYVRIIRDEGSPTKT